MQSNHYLEFQAHASFDMFLFNFVASSWSFQAAATETIYYNKWLNLQMFIFSQFWRMEVQGQCSGKAEFCESPLLADTLLPSHCAHMAFPWFMSRTRERFLSLPLPVTPSKPKYQRPQLPISSLWQLVLQQMNFGEIQTLTPNTSSMIVPKMLYNISCF